MKRWGLTIPLDGVALSDQRELIERLPDLGYTDVWSSEIDGMDAFSPLLMAAQWAPSLRLGTAIAPIYTRGPALLAMSAVTLAEEAPDRFVLGVGTSSQVIVENWNAQEFAKPYQRARDTLRFLRAALAGEKVTEEYETFSVNRFKLSRVPAKPPKIMLAALRPGMLRLAAAESDGVITNWVAPVDVPKVRAVVGPDVEIVARIFVCPTEDAELARAIGRRLITAYLTVPAYAAFHEWLGNGPRLETVWQNAH